MDDGNTRSNTVSAVDANGGAQRAATSKKYTNDDIPENRRAVGKFIKGLIAKNDLSIKKFLIDTQCTQHRGTLNRLIQGRKIVRVPEAELLVKLFGGSSDFWVTLEHKILENPDISVPLSVPPSDFSGADGRHMSNASNEFGSVASSDGAMNGQFIVLGEGADRVLIPKDIPKEERESMMQMWFDRRNEKANLSPQAPNKG